MKVAFRADASHQIGTGHVMRCLVLADTLARSGNQSTFLCRVHDGDLVDYIRSRGHAVHLLTSKHSSCTPQLYAANLEYSSWLGVTQEKDAEECLAFLSRHPQKFLVVDHYALNANWERVVRGACKYLMVIDDLANRFHDCDLLLDQNLGRLPSDYSIWTNPTTKKLIGPMYALMRPEFSELRSLSLSKKNTPYLQRLMITMGGTDYNNATERTLDALINITLPKNLEVTVIMGLHAPWISKVQKKAKLVPVSTRVLVGVSNMAELMAESDLAIGAAGSTSWESCCMGLPCIQVVLANNQVKIGNALAQTGAVVSSDLDHIQDILAAFFSDKFLASRLRNLSEASSAITDGLGAWRVVDQIIGVLN